MYPALCRKIAFGGAASFFLALLLWLPVLNLRAADGESEDWLPLAKGNYWVYQGPTKWVDTDSKSIKEEVLTWRMEITEVIRHDPALTAAVVKGYPGDLAWYDPGKKPGKYLIVRMGSHSYYLLYGEEVTKAVKQLRSKKPNLAGLANEDNLLLDTPLVEDKRYGPHDELERGEYCWHVEGSGPFTSEGIKGLSPAPRTAFTAWFRTRPDHTIMSVVPGVGIVSFLYAHHGTTSETDLGLIEVHLEKP